jgi:hypothetical protein
MIAPFDERARSASRSSQAQDWAADGKTPPLGESCGGGSGPVVIWRRDSRGRLGNASGPAVLVFRIEMATQAMSPQENPAT